jgi:epoxyqueuosine reductase
MPDQLKQAIVSHLGDHVSAIGFAPVERFAEAPETHHPANLCKGAQTVVVFGIQVPRGIFTSPDYNLYALHRSYHTVYRQLDEIGLGLCNFIESQGRYTAVMVPSYAPMVFHEFEPWGLISLKHAAVLAGLGAFGRSGQMYHPTYGARLRLAAAVTTAELDGDPIIEEDPCPKKCRACQQSCPAGAFSAAGDFQKMTCLAHTIKHAIYPLALKGDNARKHIERVVNTAGYDYWLDCDACMKACPNNR